MNPPEILQRHGQTVWQDFRALARPGISLAPEGGLTLPVEAAPWEAEFAPGSRWGDALASLLADRDQSPQALDEALIIRDAQDAADPLRARYQAGLTRDALVMLALPALLAPKLLVNNAEACIQSAIRLWRLVDRPNLMLEIPATPAGLIAAEALTEAGINVNVTMVFSVATYRAVAEAFLRGLEQRQAQGRTLQQISSFISFPLSQLDYALDQRIAGGTLRDLTGKIATANARLTLEAHQDIERSDRWQALAAFGAQPWRLIWVQSRPINPLYRSLSYANTAIIATELRAVTPAAFLKPGPVKRAREEDVAAAKMIMLRLSQADISLTGLAETLVLDGIRHHTEAAEMRLTAIAKRREELLDDRLSRLTVSLPRDLQADYDAEREHWQAQGLIRRLWAGDSSLWSGQDEGRWLGWLNSVGAELNKADVFHEITGDAARYAHILLIGMGGSSLGPEVLGDTFGRIAGHAQLHVLDSTDPTQIAATEAALDLGQTLFIISSKSGGTVEPNLLLTYFYDRVATLTGQADPSDRFIVITDPGSSMLAGSGKSRFGRIFYGDPQIGGRYSVLSPFGMVPAAALGIDTKRFLETTALMVRSCGAEIPPAANPAVQLGLILAAAARQGRDKVTFLTGPGLESFGGWAEQLIAESTGKDGQAIIPVDLEPVASPELYGQDRLFVVLTLAGRPHPDASAIDALARAGFPVLRLTLADAWQLGQEFFRWELATAVAGAVQRIHPFNQPDVEAAKRATRQLTDAVARIGRLPEETPCLVEGEFSVYADAANLAAISAPGMGGLSAMLHQHFARLRPGDYAALLAYIPRNEQSLARFVTLRTLIRDRYRVATSVGFGPRYLHSTGQAYKGGPNTGLFLQITADDPRDLPVPGLNYGFSLVKAAQARGDLDVLNDRGRRALRLHIAGDLDAGLAGLIDILAG